MALAVAVIIGAILVPAMHVAVASSGRAFEVADVPERGVGMVMGARAYPSGPSPFLAGRLDLAVALYKAGKLRAILVTGDGLPRSHDEPAIMKQYLVDRGVPADDVVEDPAGFDTYDSCVRARDVFGVTELTILTQDYHVGRAVAICRAVGVDAVGVGDETARERFFDTWLRAAVREWPANLKMEWDLLSRRVPQQDAFDDSLLRAAEG